MIDSISSMWDLLTAFFTTDVIYNPLFMGMILFNLIFFTIYFLMELLDPYNWDFKF